MAPTSAAAHAGLIRALIATGDLDGAEAALAAVSEEDAKDQLIAQARSTLELARSAPAAADLAPLEAAVAANPDDHQTHHHCDQHPLRRRDQQRHRGSRGDSRDDHRDAHRV